MPLTLAPKTLTKGEVENLLLVCEGNRRDHTIIRIALGTSLRLSEIVSLNVGQVYVGGRTVPRTEVKVKGGRIEDVMLSTRLQGLIGELISDKVERGESVEPSAPLFVSNRGRRISPRRVQVMFKEYQRRAGFVRLHNFHALRHTAITIYNETQGGDIVAAQRFARHRDVRTTLRYVHPSDEHLRAGVEALPY